MYTPPVKILDNYADVLVNFALNSGQGIKPGEVVFLQVPESAKPLLIALQKTVIKSGAHAIINYIPDEMSYDFYSLASSDQINFFPARYLKGKIDQADHFISIIAETNKHELEGIDPKKIMDRNKSLRSYIDWRDKKEIKGKFTWTLGLYATPAMAKEAGLSLKSCWHQIIKACYLDEANPVAKWHQAQQEIERVKDKLNKLDVVSFRLQSSGTDLTIGVDKNRRWCGGDGRNIPSFEVFISPDWRQTNGHISIDQPLYRYGHLVKNIFLEFKDGLVVKSSAGLGESVLKEMIAVSNADKIGEFSLTDKRLSKINHFMAETLYDENFGGKYGNVHIALGSSYQESYSKNPSRITPKQWLKMGFNNSVVHTDFVSTTDRTVTAHFSNGKNLVIYRLGQFTL